MTNSVHLMECYDRRAAEEDFIHFLLEPLAPTIEHTPNFETVRDHSIYMVIGSTGISHIPGSFFDRLKHTTGKGLFHLGDEFLAGPYEVYRHFDFVIRNHYAAHLVHAGIKTMPLGYPNSTAFETSDVAYGDRPYIWSFIGKANAAREAMHEEFAALSPHFAHVYRPANAGPMTHADYRRVLAASLFAPCPMGNVMLETWRVYEALEAGTVPILCRRALMPYHERIMPGHPLPTFRRWVDARRFAARTAADPVALERLRANVMSWWKAFKQSLRLEACDFVTRGFRGEFRESLQQWRPHTGAALQVWRVGELAKHHDLRAARGRVETIVRRLGARLAAHR